MTEWWLFLLLFWIWFLFDSLKPSRRHRFLFSGICRRFVRTQHGQAATLLPLPLLWHTAADDPPFAFSPDGITNLPAGSAGRPSADPDPAVAWRWEDIREIKQKRGRILINGADFCPATSFGTASTLRTLASRLAPLSPEKRSDILAAQLATWFRPAHLRRRKTVLIARTRLLAELGCINLIIALSVSAYLVFDGPDLVGSHWAGRLVRIAPFLGMYFGVIHLALSVLAWRAHRKLMPAQSEARLSLVLNALLLPPLALRLRGAISPAYFAAQHPLSWLAAMARPDDLACFARQMMSDLRWPLPPLRTQNPELLPFIHQWMHSEITRHASRLLAASGLTEEKLLAPPAPDSPASLTYCPRCRDQFVTPSGRCARGPKPLALK